MRFHFDQQSLWKNPCTNRAQLAPIDSCNTCSPSDEHHLEGSLLGRPHNLWSCNSVGSSPVELHWHPSSRAIVAPVQSSQSGTRPEPQSGTVQPSYIVAHLCCRVDPYKDVGIDTLSGGALPLPVARCRVETHPPAICSLSGAGTAVG